MSLFDADDPDPRPKLKEASAARGGRGDFTIPEKLVGIEDLKEAMGGDSFVLARTMALSLYRLGAEPLNKLAANLLSLLEGSV